MDINKINRLFDLMVDDVRHIKRATYGKGQ